MLKCLDIKLMDYWNLCFCNCYVKSLKSRKENEKRSNPIYEKTLNLINLNLPIYCFTYSTCWPQAKVGSDGAILMFAQNSFSALSYLDKGM